MYLKRGSSSACVLQTALGILLPSNNSGCQGREKSMSVPQCVNIVNIVNNIVKSDMVSRCIGIRIKLCSGFLFLCTLSLWFYLLALLDWFDYWIIRYVYQSNKNILLIQRYANNLPCHEITENVITEKGLFLSCVLLGVIITWSRW